LSCITESFTFLELPSHLDLLAVAAESCAGEMGPSGDDRTLFLSSHSVIIIMVLAAGISAESCLEPILCQPDRVDDSTVFGDRLCESLQPTFHIGAD
jgi:hypothetical protein